MKIKDIEIDGFGVWSGLSVDSLPDGMTVFYGPNEAGKTTLMQFLRAILYGFTPDRRSRYLPPVYGGRPGGTMRVTGPGGGYEIARRAQLNENSLIGQLTVTSSDGMVQGQHRLAMLLGQVDESIFTNVFAIGLRELQELSTLDDTAAADELYKLSSGLDRVSLVDVMRQLRGAREQIVGPTSDAGQMQSLMQKREKLKDEQEQWLGKGKRWGELAAQRRSHQVEIDDLLQRREQWEIESKQLETAMQVREPWSQRDQLSTALAKLNARVDLPDGASKRLQDLQTQIEERKDKVLALKEQRKNLRQRAMALPVRSNVLALASKIDAAAEQMPWIGALQKQIVRLESEIASTREQLLEDAKRLGVSEADQQALLNDKRMASLPDLSSQTISQLAAPARDVRIHTVRFKQAKTQGENDKQEAARLGREIEDFLAEREQTDLQESIQQLRLLHERLREQQSLNERLEKLHRHRKDLQEEALDLEAEDALPLERFFVLLIPFVFGSILFILGFIKTFHLSQSVSPVFSYDPRSGPMLAIIGAFILVLWYTWKGLTEKGTGSDLEDCEGQLDALVRQIRKTEQDRDELAKGLPAYTGTPDQQMREIEHELLRHEELLPVQHNRAAAEQRYQSARKRANAAATSLKQAKSQWRKLLHQLGLAESLSPKSIRILAEGYEALLQTRRRLKTQEDELSQRKLELAGITQRVEGLASQVAAVLEEVSLDLTPDRTRRSLAESRDSRKEARRGERDRSGESPRRGGSNEEDEVALSPQARRFLDAPSVDSAEGAVRKLQDLGSLLTEQQAFLQQRKQLKEEDIQVSKQQKQLQRAIDRLILSRQSLLAELGVENREQLDQHLALKQEHLKMQSQIQELDTRIRAIVGGNAPYESITKILTSYGGSELERRWDGLQQRIQQASQRSTQLHQRQGEISQEMKSLASDRRLAEIKLEISVIENQLHACARNWQTLAATTNMLEKVCEVYETERQPETLREASTFLRQLTDDKYTRVWTPLGKNALRIDNQQGQALPLEVLSRGTREAVFIALRLSLAAAYARRGVMLPLVLDDVLVNFDTIRARQAAKVLRDFAELGNQVIMFTCHEHIMRMFHEIGVQVRVLPPQGHPGEAEIFYMPAAIEVAPRPPEPVVEMEYDEEPVHEEPEPIPVADPIAMVEQPPMAVPPPMPEPVVHMSRISMPRKPKSQRRPAPMPPIEPEIAPGEKRPEIDRLWYEIDPLQAIWTEIELPDSEDEPPPPPPTDGRNEAWWTHA